MDKGKEIAYFFLNRHTSISVTSFSLPLAAPKVEPSANVDLEPTYT